MSWCGRVVQRGPVTGGRVRNPGGRLILAAFGEGSGWLQWCAEKRLPRFGWLDAARICPAELACVPSNNCSQWFSDTGRERMGSRETCCWLASCCLGSDVPSPPGCLGGEAETAFKCRLSVLQLGAEPEREALAASDAGGRC